MSPYRKPAPVPLVPAEQLFRRDPGVGFTTGIALITAFAMGAILACAAASPTPAQQSAVILDGIEEKNCVDNATRGGGKAELRADIDACRARIRARYEAGAP